MQRHQTGAASATEVHLPPRLASRHRLGAALGGQQREGALDSGGRWVTGDNGRIQRIYVAMWVCLKMLG